MTTRAIDPGGFSLPRTSFPGPRPELAWLEIVDLIVDETYQRRISRSSRAAIQAIADHFAWSSFSPVIVAPLEGGRYAIIDGQHRTTAAAVCGFTSVPCEIVRADPRQQAAAFAAVNGRVQRISTMQVYHAAVAAEEPWAARIAAVAAGAGCTVLRYPIAAHLPARPVHSTMSVRSIQRVIEKYDDARAVLVLRCITQTPLGDDPGVLGERWIGGIASALADRPAWVEAGEAKLLAFFEAVDAGAVEKSSGDYRHAGHISAAEALAIVLRQELDRVEPDFASQAAGESA